MINFYTYDPSQQKQKQTKHKGTGLKVLVSLKHTNIFNNNLDKYVFFNYTKGQASFGERILESDPDAFLFQMHQSNEHQVVLKKVKIGSSGRYKCEVGEM